jgi:hypothetical protein
MAGFNRGASSEAGGKYPFTPCPASQHPASSIQETLRVEILDWFPFFGYHPPSFHTALKSLVTAAAFLPIGVEAMALIKDR